MSEMHETPALWRDQHGICHRCTLIWQDVDGVACEAGNANEALTHAGETETKGWNVLPAGTAQVYRRAGGCGEYLVAEELV